MNTYKKALDPSLQPMLDKVVKNTSFPTLLQQSMSESLQAGKVVDPQNPESVTNALNKVPENELSEEDKKVLLGNIEAVQYLQQNVSTSATASYNTMPSGTRTLLNDLNKKYSSASLDLLQALKVWKEARLTPEMIKNQVRNDIGKKLSLAEAKTLYKIGSDITSGLEELNFGEEINKTIEDVRSVRLTPTVRASVERVGNNLFRTKNASILWKIDMKQTDDGQQVPYLVRIETIEANDEEENIKV